MNSEHSLLNVAVVGASGYGGGELLRLLLAHPRVKLSCAVSQTYAEQPLYHAWPGLAHVTKMTFSRELGDASYDVVFLAQENGKAMKDAAALLSRGCKVIDLSADFRFKNSDVYAQWYSKHSSPELAAEAVYGLPELFREDIRGARLVGNPGCYPTASILALAPLLKTSTIDTSSIIIDAKSGVSGAGRAKFGLDYHYPEVESSVSAYKIAGTHRHTPEIENVLSSQCGAQITLSFTPHLMPMSRGILATCYGKLTRSLDTRELLDLYTEEYADDPFVVVCSDRLPATKHVLGTNACHIGLSVDTRTSRVTIVSVIDNLTKGAAGQAIQNMNLMTGLDETEGLLGGGLWP